jgi:hypothetical protein
MRKPPTVTAAFALQERIGFLTPFRRRTCGAPAVVAVVALRERLLDPKLYLSQRFG